MVEIDDQRLVRGARSGEARALAQLVGRHYPMLLTSCRRMLGDGDLARDAAQEACLRAMLGLDQLRDDARFGAWLVGIGLNVCRGWLAVAHRQVSYDAMRESGRLPEPVSPAAGPVERLASRELADRVRAALAGLPRGQRQAVALFYIAGLTHAEAADELGTQPGAVKTRLHKARRSLRASLKDTYQEYVEMTDASPQMIPMRVAELRRTAPNESGVTRHIVFLEDERGRRLPIWIGPAEASAMALILEQVELPRPGVYQFAAALLAGAGGRLREVRVTELTASVFYARAVLADATSIDARPSDALTLALVDGVPIYVDAGVLDRAQETAPELGELMDEAEQATGDARVIAAEARAAYAAIGARPRDPGA